MNEDTSQTEWSGAPLTNKRIHDTREMIRICALNGDIKQWIILLEQLNHDLYGFESQEEQIKIRNKITELMDEIQEQVSKKQVNKKTLPIPPKIMFQLNQIYYDLDLIFHKSGLQTYIKEEAGDAF